MYEQYNSRVAFFVVYIMEAHPVDAWEDDDNLKEKIKVTSPKSLTERCALAGTCMTKLAVKIPPLIDDLFNSTEIAYTAWPDRLYVVDRDGRIAYKSKPGPYGFKPDQMAEVLKRLVGKAPDQMAQAPVRHSSPK